MKADNVALGKDVCGRGQAFDPATERTVGTAGVGDDTHAESQSDASHTVGHMSVRVKADGLAHKFCSSLAVKALAGKEEEHGEHKFGHGV